MIKSFKNSLTEDVFDGVVRKGFPADLIKVARRKLRFLHAAHILTDLRAPPGNRLEALKGDRVGNTQSASMTSSGSALSGPRMDQKTLN
jgi:proteic killer suppression protein